MSIRDQHAQKIRTILQTKTLSRFGDADKNTQESIGLLFHE